ncbi:hypothetical protein FS594_06895 [Rahnella aquatilis]|jgi:type 1 fimbria pilin|nr:hypothetical protein FS594_06895 [Rahnella aquatilis]
MNRMTCVLFLGVMASGTIQFATAAASGGIIHFTGAIVDGGCQFNAEQNRVISHCERDGRQIRQVHTVNVHTPSSFALPLSLGKVTTQHINNDPRLAVMTVNYN